MRTKSGTEYYNNLRFSSKSVNVSVRRFSTETGRSFAKNWQNRSSVHPPDNHKPGPISSGCFTRK